VAQTLLEVLRPGSLQLKYLILHLINILIRVHLLQNFLHRLGNLAMGRERQAGRQTVGKREREKVLKKRSPRSQEPSLSPLHCFSLVEEAGGGKGGGLRRIEEDEPFLEKIDLVCQEAELEKFHLHLLLEDLQHDLTFLSIHT